MIGLGYRREMRDWNLATLPVDFYEVAPENWVHRDRAPLHALLAMGKPIRFHGVSLNLGGHSAVPKDFLRQVSDLMDELGCAYYSDHLAASGDAHQLYDLFPIPWEPAEVRRVADRICQVQDILGRRIGVENTTWYTNVGSMREFDFLAQVLERADCQLLLDLNNVAVNRKNHGSETVDTVLSLIDPSRVSYCHVAGHEWDADLDMYIDTHSRPVEGATAQAAQWVMQHWAKDVLLEWDHDLPDGAAMQEELACLQRSTTT